MPSNLTAVISDIHANYVALEAALADIERAEVDRIVCLGDVAQGGPQPRETVDRLAKLDLPIVLGNADAWLLGEETAEPETDEQLETKQWTNAQLGAEGMEFLRSFRPTLELTLDGDATLFCFHGSPKSYDDVLLPETPSEELDGLTDHPSVRVLAGGHTHTQWLRDLGDRIFFNPGSIGLSYNRRLPEEIFYINPWADYALLSVDGGCPAVEFRQVPYDVGDLIASARASRMPHPESYLRFFERRA